MQEAFARAWKAWSELRDLAQVKAWLFTILRNECARGFARKQVETASGEIDESQLPPMPSFEAGVEMAQMVGMLPVTYREPLLLQVLGGYSCAEIAAMLGTSEGAVMTRLTRARQAFRQQYADAGTRRAAK